MRSVIALLVGLVAAAGPAAAQGTLEWQAQGVATVTGAEFYGGGLGVAYRTAGRTRVGFLASVGDRDGAFAGRGELMLSYHLNPYKRRGLTPYAGGGLSVTLTEDASTEYILLVLGVESSPGGRFGWFAEVGVAGGVRLALGIQLRTGRR